MPHKSGIKTAIDIRRMNIYPIKIALCSGDDAIDSEKKGNMENNIFESLFDYNLEKPTSIDDIKLIF